MGDGVTVGVGSTRGKVYIYDMLQNSNTPKHTFQAHKTSVRSLKFMPTAKLKVSSSFGFVFIFNCLYTCHFEIVYLLAQLFFR